MVSSRALAACARAPRRRPRTPSTGPSSRSSTGPHANERRRPPLSSIVVLTPRSTGPHPHDKAEVYRHPRPVLPHMRVHPRRRPGTLANSISRAAWSSRASTIGSSPSGGADGYAGRRRSQPRSTGVRSRDPSPRRTAAMTGRGGGGRPPRGRRTGTTVGCAGSGPLAIAATGNGLTKASRTPIRSARCPRRSPIRARSALATYRDSIGSAASPTSTTPLDPCG
jgi:hypothetical protein